MKVLSPDKLRQRCDPDLFDAPMTDGAAALGDLIGQDRAVDAICLSSSITGDTMVLSVRDTGPGVPPEIRDEIFDAFVSSKKGKRSDPDEGQSQRRRRALGRCVADL